MFDMCRLYTIYYNILQLYRNEVGTNVASEPLNFLITVIYNQ